MAGVTFDTTVGGDGSTVTDDANATTGLANGGHRVRLVPALAQIVAIALWVKNRALDVLGYKNDAAASAAAASTNGAAQVALATAQANAAAASAATALNAPGTSATSATAIPVGDGSKSLTIQTGKSIPVGGKVVISRTSDPVGWWMHGPVTAHDPVTGALTVNVTRHVGTGTVSDWTVSISGPEGPQGIQGQSGVVVWQRVSTTSTLSAAPAKWLADTLAAPIDLTLDPALPDLSEIIIKDRKGTFGTNRCRMLPGTGRTIMGATLLDLTINYAEHRLVLDGTDWRV